MVLNKTHNVHHTCKGTKVIQSKNLEIHNNEVPFTLAYFDVIGSFSQGCTSNLFPSINVFLCITEPPPPVGKESHKVIYTQEHPEKGEQCKQSAFYMTPF